MMDYYEELGVDRSASPEEIRLAYKRLVRLLHPDHCSDEQVRPLADLQMKRLNGVLRVLTNPDERAIYDRGVDTGLAPRGLPPPPPRLAPQWYWPVAGTAALLVLVSLLAHTPPPPPIAAQEQPLGVSTAAASKKPVSLARTHASERKTFMVEEPYREPEPVEVSLPGARPKDTPVPAPDTEASTTGKSPSHPVEISPPAVPVSEFAHPPPRPQFTGEWLYVSSPHSTPSGLYPPEYIELHLTEESGILYGRYRARYHIPDQAISPTVSFQFEGQAGPDRASFPWYGAGGAKGEVRLRLLTPEALEVTWVAVQLGEQLGLISGTATLVRKLD